MKTNRIEDCIEALGTYHPFAVEARAELTAICEENERLKTDIECIMANMPIARRLVNQRNSIDSLQQKNASLKKLLRELEWAGRKGRTDD